MRTTLQIATNTQGLRACEAMIDLAELDPRIVVLTADLMRSTQTWEFKKRFPDRYFEMGLAEQNMMGFAAGLALTGMIPFVTSFAAFAMLRACEQVNVDLAYARTNVKIVGTHSGISCEQSGPTHHSLIDLAVARAMPNLTVIVPSGPTEAYKATKASVAVDGPVFIRLGRKPSYQIYEEDYEYVMGSAIVLREGRDASIIACGRAVGEALKAAEELARQGIEIRVVNMHTLKPLDNKAILDAASETGAILTVEEHSIIGGLGGAVAEVLAEARLEKLRFRRIGINDTFCKIGTEEELYSYYGLDAKGITAGFHGLLG